MMGSRQVRQVEQGELFYDFLLDRHVEPPRVAGPRRGFLICGEPAGVRISRL